jgi:hypothetical protein
MPPKRTSNLQEKPSTLKRKRAALQNMKFLIFSIFVGHFCGDPADQNQWGSMRMRIRNTGRRLTRWNCVLLKFKTFVATCFGFSAKAEGLYQNKLNKKNFKLTLSERKVGGVDLYHQRE